MNNTKHIEKPYRTPAHIEHMTAEPPFARSGTKGCWKLHFVLSRDVPDNHRLLLQIHGKRSNGIQWPGLQVNDDQAEGYISMSAERHGVLKPLKPIDSGLFEFQVPEHGLSKGEHVTVDIGGAKGAAAPSIATSSKFFLLQDIASTAARATATRDSSPAETAPSDEMKLTPFVLTKETEERVVGVCQIVFAGGDAVKLEAYAPSTASAGQRIAILVRPEDLHGNVATSDPGDITVRLDGTVLPVSVEPIDQSSCRRISDITLPGPGTYRLEVEAAGLRTLTNPIVCTVEPKDTKILWGMIHGHTEMSDGFGTLDHYFKYMRDECRLDFGATGDHDHLWETLDDMWEAAQETVAGYNAPGRFTTFLGYEWAKWRRKGEGDRNVYYFHDRRPMYRSDDGHYPEAPELFEALKDEKAIIIPHHTANPRSFCDWKHHDPEKERLVEIYSRWGNSERSAADGNPLPVQAPHSSDPYLGEWAPGFVQKALEMGWRVGFTAGGDEHRAHAGDNLSPLDEKGTYRAGLMAVHAKENTREAIWDALWNRRCYGTTGARIALDFTVNGQPMGSEISASAIPGIDARRTIRISVHGTDALTKVDIVRNNVDVLTLTPNEPDAGIEWVDDVPLREVYLPPALHSPTPFVFYYVRVTQADGEMAWASPVWIVP